MKVILPLLSILPSVALAQYGNSGSGSSSSSAASVATATSSSSSSLQTVTVGKGGLKFSPDTIVAKSGEKIVFTFAAGFHSVTQGAFDTPCAPLSQTSLNSGFVNALSAPSPDVFTVTVNSTDPIYIYCAQANHCMLGMSMVINSPSSGNTIDAYRLAAAKTGNGTKPASIEGGILAVPSSGSGSASSTAGASASATAKSEGLLTTQLSFASLLFGAAAVLALVI